MMLPGKPLSAADANAPPPAKKPKTTTKTPPDPTESIVGKLGVLTNAQLVAVVRTLLERGAVSAELVESIVPAPDLSPLFAEGEHLSYAIQKALPASRYGSATDHYGYKRCASACAACKRFILDNAKAFKNAKQWGTLKDYCAGMLPVAESMVVFDVENDNKTRKQCIDALVKLQDEATKKL